ncbi:hypothetical protein AB6A40_003457 [Gnathostoma spinigerum]|uniref:Integrator complex subunit 10 n=1 Tax=Gnathostoma spinigerum TaxID=75299 RepID=A0ABD6E9M4_9BILA
MTYAFVKDLNAKGHLELCLKENKDYSIGKSHYRLASLYDDFDATQRDLAELQFQLKWRRPQDAHAPLERLVRSQGSSDTWSIIREIFLTAYTQSTSAEYELFSHISADVMENIIGGISSHHLDDDVLKLRLLLFAMKISSDEKYDKLVNRTVTFLSERACIDKDLTNGIGRYHVLLAIAACPVLIQRNFAGIPIARAVSVVQSNIHVAVAWPQSAEKWIGYLRTISSEYALAAESYMSGRWTASFSLLDKFRLVYEQGTDFGLRSDSRSCASLRTCIDKSLLLKSEAKKLCFLIFIWYPFSIWRAEINDDRLLAWIPENSWARGVDKILDDNSVETESYPSLKKRRINRERRDVFITPSTAAFNDPTMSEIAEAYELCSDVITLYGASISVAESCETLKFVSFFPESQRFISESLIYKCKRDEAIAHLNERLEKTPETDDSFFVLLFHLACANALERNWAESLENILEVISQEHSRESFQERRKLSCVTKESASRNVSQCRSEFRIVERSSIEWLMFDVLYHILFKVYTSTNVDHENDHLLGALMVVSQIEFANRGHLAFNRIMRHIEAKGSFLCPGLIKYITNAAILEELARVQEFCSEYVSIQIGSSQIQRRIGQSTRHSVRGTKDEQKQAIEEQMKRWRESPVKPLLEFFSENKEQLLKILGSR